MALVPAAPRPRLPNFSSHSLRNWLVGVLIVLLSARGSGAAQTRAATDGGGERLLYLDLAEPEVHLLLHQTLLFNLVQNGSIAQQVVVAGVVQHADVVQLVPGAVQVGGEGAPPNATYSICALGTHPGHTDLTFNVTPPGIVDVEPLWARVTVMQAREIYVVSYLMGWVYFAAWSVSFYPQMFYNWSRKSVVGLNFDFLALNLLGFTLYSLFNCGLYFTPLIQEEYFSRHPRGLNPVQLNDVFFSLHATFATLVTIAQCFIYERGGQSVSLTARGVVGALLCVVGVSGALAAAGTLHWLDFLYYCSYVKLTITLIKYIPQAYMNYKRKSTVGWSIANIFLDFVGGALSILQMLLNAYNYDDWASIFGDATKFGLGLFSLTFDIFFMLQHYVFYRHAEEKKASLGGA